MPGHKTSLKKFKKTEIISSIFSEHSAKRKINYKEKPAKPPTNIWRLNNKLLNNQRIREETKKYLETNEMETL